MEYYTYYFLCEKIPNKLTMHSLVTHFLGKDKVNESNFKVAISGKILILKTDFEFNESNFELDLINQKKQKFLCKLIKTEKSELKKYLKGDKVNVSGLIEYGINITGNKGKKCPYFKGRFESKELRVKFKENIERSLGCKVPNMTRENFNRMVSEVASSKIQFNNIIEMDLDVIVDDESKFNSLQYRSVFQKKSYGFGNLNIL